MTDHLLVFVGTYTRDTKSEGIYVCDMDLSSGALRYVNKTINVANPSFLAIDPRRQYLYAVNEIPSYKGEPTGTISAFSIDRFKGELTFLNKQPTLGTAPCYVSLDKTNNYVLVANYSSGSVSVFPILIDGRLGEATDVIQHQGSSINPVRQKGPHAHSIILSPDNRFVLAADLGLDKILIYKFDRDHGKLIPHDWPWIQVTPGAGPRHLTFHPTGHYVYLINELHATLTVFLYDQAHGKLTKIQTVPTLPPDFHEKNYSADIHLDPAGKCVYTSNRGHNSITLHSIDEQTGKLTFVDRQSTLGKTPRNFAIDPTGRFLLVANQDSDMIITFHINSETGKLTSTGHIAEIPSPVCLKVISSN